MESLYVSTCMAFKKDSILIHRKTLLRQMYLRLKRFLLITRSGTINIAIGIVYDVNEYKLIKIGIHIINFYFRRIINTYIFR